MRRTAFLLTLVCLPAVTVARGTAPPATLSGQPGPELNLVLTAPIATWDEAIPLGNGLMGGLLWGGGATLRLSLDRGDLWDERPADGMRWDLFTYANLIEKVGEQDYKYIDDVFDRAYRDAHPSKIPAGRVEIDARSRPAAREVRVEPRHGGRTGTRRGRRARGGVLQRGAAGGAPADSRARRRGQRGCSHPGWSPRPA